MPVIAANIVKILQKRRMKSSVAYETLVNILKIISNGVTSQNLAQDSPIMRVTYQFWLSVILPLMGFAAPNQVEAANLNAIVESLLHYLRHASCEEEEGLEPVSKDWPRYEVQNGEHVEKFADALKSDQNDHWHVNNTQCLAIITDVKGRETFTYEARLGDFLGSQTIQEMLEAASPYLEPQGGEPVLMSRSTPLEAVEDRIMKSLHF